MSAFGTRFRRLGAVGCLMLLVIAVLLTFADRGRDLGRKPAAGSRKSEPASVPAYVTRVIDGDTVEVRIRGHLDEVRYIGIDTPETVKPGTPVQCFGPPASAFNHRLVENRRVRLVFDRERRDVYGRLLAYVYLGRKLVNASLVGRGYARTLTIPPNVTHAGLLHRLARTAGRNGRGLWAAC